ncbi:MAG: metalloregulator ArsR/SmtB family transcription factor [Acidobacteriota bacterium]
MSSPEPPLSIPEPQGLNQTTAPVFAAMGDPTRLGLVARLSAGESLSIAQLTEGTGLTRQGVTKHLRTLEAAGIVTRRRVGRESRFAYAPKPLDDARHFLDRVSRQWDDAIGRLRAFVEDD